MEEEEWEKEGTERSSACSPRTNVQSGWRRTHTKKVKSTIYYLFHFKITGMMQTRKV